MNILEITLAVYEAGDVCSGLEAIAAALPDTGDPTAVVWVPPAPARPLWTGPEGWTPPAALLESARTAVSSMLAELDPETTGLDAAVDVLTIPAARTGALVVASAAAVAVEPRRWERTAAALATLSERDRAGGEDATAASERISALEAERHDLRRRVEEGEALHTLGLAANRSLDPDEVLELVTRLTRTALGATYVTVSTTEQGSARTTATAGLRGVPPEHDALADQVIEAGKTVKVGGGEALSPDDFPLHAAEGMIVGMGVPLSLYGDVIGALVLGYRRQIDLTPRHVRLALTLAGHAAVAISNARLHRALAMRTAEAERAYEELRWSAEAKERFFAALSHELRTPLNAILGYHSLILDGVAGEVAPGVEEFLTNSHRAARGLLHLVNDVLDLSKIEAGKVELHREQLGARELLMDAVAAVQPMADQKQLQLIVEPMEELPPLNTDVDRVRQILVNLLSNAIKFTDAGQISIGVELMTAGLGRRAGDRTFRIAVRDTGPGIPEADQERIFHEFEQIRGPSSHGGTGLGLPISRKLARLLGGELTVESGVGEGAVFVLSLPLESPEEQGTTIASAEEPIQ